VAGLVLSGVLVTALAALYTAFHFRTHDHAELQRATQHLLQGETHWVTFQNRILGPWLIQSVCALTSWSWLRVFYLLVFGCMAAGGGLLVWRAWRGPQGAAYGLAQATGWFLLAYVFNDGWSYPWDFIGALLNLMLVLWAFDRFHEAADLWSWPLLGLLVALALNRESSLIALVALFVAAVAAGVRSRHLASARRALVALAAAGMANVVLIRLLRQELFVHSNRPAAIGPAHELAMGNFMQVRENFFLVATNSETLLVRTVVLAIGSALLAFGVFLVRDAVRSWRGAGWSAAGCFGACYFWIACLAIALFADMRELRVYFELIPFIVVLAGRLVNSSDTSTHPA
jgi:hypothetical protein